MFSAIEIEGFLRSYGNSLFPTTMDAYLAADSRQLWGLRIDVASRRMLPFFGSISENDERLLNSRGFFDTIAGYRANVRTYFPDLSANCDVFLINTEALDYSNPLVQALIVHELCHWYIDSGLQASHAVAIDSAALSEGANLYAITTPSHHHDRDFCNLMCAVSARAIANDAPFATRQDLVNQAMRFDVLKESSHIYEVLNDDDGAHAER